MFRIFNSLRSRIMILILLGVIPFLVLFLYTHAHHRIDALEEARKDTLTLAKGIANLQECIMAEGRSLVHTLAQLPQVKARDAAACNALFAVLLAETQRFIVFNAVNLDGIPFAGAPPLTEPVTYADRDWFPRLLETKEIVISQYLIGKRAQKPILAFAAPVFEAPGELTAVVTAALDLEWLHQFFARVALPRGVGVVVFDRLGTVLARYPDPELLVGRSLPEAPMTKAILAGEEGVLELPDITGEERVIGFTTLGPQMGGLHIAVTIPQAIVYAQARRELTINLITLGLVAMLALSAAWFGGDILVRRPVHALVGLTQKIREGDLSARSGLTSGVAEIDRLARAFDEAAEALQSRETQRRQAEAALRQSENHLLRVNRALNCISESNQALVRATDEPAFLRDICRIVVEVGGYKMAWIGLARPDASLSVRPAAQAGFEEGYLLNLNLTWADTERGQGPTGTAIRTRQPQIARDILSDPKFAPWREEALKRGYASSLALPLLVSGEAIGALNVYADEPDAFDQKEVELLEELAVDAAFGIMMLRTRAERQEAGENVRRQNALLDGINRIFREALLCENEEDLGHTCLAVAEEMTGSRFGFIAEVNRKGLLDTIAISNSGWQACGIVRAKDPELLNNLEVRGIRGLAVQEGKSVLTNNPSSHPHWIELPEGHLPITAFLGVPLKHAGKIIGLVGLGNKEGGYKGSKSKTAESPESYKYRQLQ